MERNSAVMNFRKNRLTIKEAKEIDLADYLSVLGYEPSKIRNNDYWYLSPLRNEKEASFKINRRLNRWYDHGWGRGGNIIDFGILYHSCSVSEFLQRMSGESSFQMHRPRHSYVPEQYDNKIVIQKDNTLSSFKLLQYLELRKIPNEIAQQYCREVHYELNGKIYYGVGFRNDSGGYEIRSAYFKEAVLPKTSQYLITALKRRQSLKDL